MCDCSHALRFGLTLGFWTHTHTNVFIGFCITLLVWKSCGVFVDCAIVIGFTLGASPFVSVGYVNAMGTGPCLWNAAGTFAKHVSLVETTPVLMKILWCNRKGIRVCDGTSALPKQPTRAPNLSFQVFATTKTL